MPNVVVDAVMKARALGVGGANTTIPNIVDPTSTSDAPFFTTIPPSTLPSTAGSSGNDLTKTILEWIFAIAALLVIASLTLCRYAQLRRTNRPLNAFLPRPHPFDPRSRRDAPQRTTSGRRVPRTTGLPFDQSPVQTAVPLTIPQSLFYPPFLNSVGGAGNRRNQRRAARGADIDAQGRRGGAPDTDDRPDSETFDKEILPAYESVGGPPKYLELDATTGIPLYSLHSPSANLEEQAQGQVPVHISFPEPAQLSPSPTSPHPPPTRVVPAPTAESELAAEAPHSTPASDNAAQRSSSEEPAPAPDPSQS